MIREMVNGRTIISVDHFPLTLKIPPAARHLSPAASHIALTVLRVGVYIFGLPGQATGDYRITRVIHGHDRNRNLFLNFFNF
jgi:hypothetical protein